MNIIKRTVSAVLCTALVMGLSGCTLGEDTAWIAKKGDTEYAAGIYIQNMITAYSEAYEKSGYVQNVLDQQIEGIKAEEWIKLRTKTLTDEFIASEQKFEDMKLSLTDAEVQYLESMVNYQWETYGKMYEENGISKDSYSTSFKNAMKQSLIFTNLYKEGGERAVPAEEIQKYFNENYARAQYVAYPVMIKPADAAADWSDTNKAKVDEIFGKAKEGANLSDLIIEYTNKDFTAEEEKLTETEMQTIKAGNILDKNNLNGIPKALADKVFAIKEGELETFSDEQYHYIVTKMPLDPDNTAVSQYTNNILTALKTDEFNGLLSQWAAEMKDVSYNEKAISKYTPKKLKMD